MRQRVGQKKVDKLIKQTGLPITTVLVRGGTGHRKDLHLEDGTIVHAWPDGTYSEGGPQKWSFPADKTWSFPADEDYFFSRHLLYGSAGDLIAARAGEDIEPCGHIHRSTIVKCNLTRPCDSKQIRLHLFSYGVKITDEHAAQIAEAWENTPGFDIDWLFDSLISLFGRRGD